MWERNLELTSARKFEKEFVIEDGNVFTVDVYNNVVVDRGWLIRFLGYMEGNLIVTSVSMLSLVSMIMKIESSEQATLQRSQSRRSIVSRCSGSH